MRRGGPPRLVPSKRSSSRTERYRGVEAVRELRRRCAAALPARDRRADGARPWPGGAGVDRVPRRPSPPDRPTSLVSGTHARHLTLSLSSTLPAPTGRVHHDRVEPPWSTVGARRHAHPPSVCPVTLESLQTL